MKPTEKQKNKIEGYAEALQSLLYTMKGYNTCGKSYDPMVCDDEEMLSYAFDLKDGGRHHKFKDYEDEYEILEIMINEIIEEMKN